MRPFLSFVLSLFLLCSLRIGAKPLEISWLVDDAPPFFITEGQYARQGICDITQNYLIKALPEVNHRIVEVPAARLTHMMKSGEKACFSCMIHRPVNDEESTFSLPNIVYPPHVLVVTESLKQELLREYGSPISLDDVMENDELIFTHHVGRKFGPFLQPIIEAKGSVSRTILLHNEDRSTTTMFEMLTRGRAHFSIEYSAIVSFYNESATESLAVIPIKENSDQLVYGAVACATTAEDDFADQAVERINAAFGEILKNKEYQKDIQRWFKIDESEYQSWLSEMHDTYYQINKR